MICHSLLRVRKKDWEKQKVIIWERWQAAVRCLQRWRQLQLFRAMEGLARFHSAAWVFVALIVRAVHLNVYWQHTQVGGPGIWGRHRRKRSNNLQEAGLGIESRLYSGTNQNVLLEKQRNNKIKILEPWQKLSVAKHEADIFQLKRHILNLEYQYSRKNFGCYRENRDKDVQLPYNDEVSTLNPQNELKWG